MTRALYGAYNGPLYALARVGSQHGHAATTADIGVDKPGGIADAKAHDDFCASGDCFVYRIYDQSPEGNHLGIEHGAPNLHPPRNSQDLGVNFSDPRSKASLSGQPVYAAFFAGAPFEDRSFVGQGYSNRTARGTAVGDEPQSMYAVFGGKHFNNLCCFDYGNAENVDANGRAGPMADGTMEAIYFGSSYAPQGPGSGSGPWIGADMENGIYEGGSKKATSPSLPLVDFRVGMVKGNSGNEYSIKTGDAQVASSLSTVYTGPRPPAYGAMRKQGAIILGIGGDNSPWAAGIFYEGVMTAGYASNETEATVFANIVAAGYK
eukprot:CAMPEP_0206299692 /NCGR_PEP_ID=MMETSP0106_2-20121207/7317_1 /ASSEMBLY_ACC=CAM_ASM_000206 /TAXON_ID=81532 /ORGANISM="Acanthoeca-like sp., Strain 10tr" /LENGTH=319 /DNA_ID=CAMNT_0053730393 /DNA_START=241 /DNA_END=1200 /DNA_ORIENTATION=+